MSHYKLNKDKLLQYQKEYNVENKESIKKYHKQYYNLNSVAIKEKQNVNKKLRRMNKVTCEYFENGYIRLDLF
jgi:hypothetical protein